MTSPTPQSAAPQTTAVTTPDPSIHIDPTAATAAALELQQTYQSLQSAFAGVPQAIIQGLVNSILNALGLGAFTGDVDAALTKIENTLGGFIKDIETIVSDFQNLLSSIGSLFDVSSDVTGFVSALEDIGGDVTSLISGIISGLGGSGAGLSGAISALEGVGSDFTSLFSGLINAIKGAGSGLASDVSGAITAVEDLVGSLFGSGNPVAAQVQPSVLPAALGGSDLVSDLESMATQLFGSATSSGTVQASAVSNLPATQILSGSAMSGISSSIQNALDGVINAFENTAGVVGQDAAGFVSSLVGIPTGITNSLTSLTGHGTVATATTSDANAAMSQLASSVSQTNSQVASLLTTVNGPGGFATSVAFLQPVVSTYLGSGQTGGTATYVLPTALGLGVGDFFDVLVLGAGGGATGAGVSASGGAAGAASTAVLTNVTWLAGSGTSGLTVSGAGGAGGVLNSGAAAGGSPGDYTLDSVVYTGGASQSGYVNGNGPGGGGGPPPGAAARGGLAGSWAWASFSISAASPTISITVGSGGNGGTGLGGTGKAGAAGGVWIVARKALPSTFTVGANTPVSGTTPFLYNGSSYTDEVTASALWNAPPDSISGGAGVNGLMIRHSTSGPTYVWLALESVSGGTNWTLGNMAAGVPTTFHSAFAPYAVQLNSWSLTSDSGYDYTVSVAGQPLYTYSDTAHVSTLGSGYRDAGWFTSDVPTPGGIAQFAFYDTGDVTSPIEGFVATSDTATSTSYVGNLASTVGPSVSLVVPSTGIVMVHIYCGLESNSTANDYSYASFSMSGANTFSPSDDSRALGVMALASGLTINASYGATFIMSGLTPGTTTFEMVYRVTGGTGTFQNRRISVTPWTG